MEERLRVGDEAPKALARSTREATTDSQATQKAIARLRGHSSALARAIGFGSIRLADVKLTVQWVNNECVLQIQEL